MRYLPNRERKKKDRGVSGGGGAKVLTRRVDSFPSNGHILLIGRAGS